MRSTPRRTTRWLLALVGLAGACGGGTFSLGDGRLFEEDGASDAPPPEGEPTAELDASRPSGADAGTGTREDGESAEDAASGAPAVDASTPSGGGVRLAAPTAISELTMDDPSDDDPALTSDLLVMYFNSKREGGAGKEDIWLTTRARADQPWAAPRPASELNTDQRETGIALSADGLTLWFSSDRPGGAGGLDVYVARRASRSARFERVERVEALSAPGDDLISAIADEQKTAYLSVRESEDDDYDLVVARRASVDASWSRPEPISSLNTDGRESDACPLEGGRRLIFTRDGELRLAERTSDDSYRVVDDLTALNSSKNERDAWATDDLSLIVFSSNRSGTYMLYVSRLE